MSMIEKLSILGIRSFGTSDCDRQVIEFLEPLTLILGANGTGKTDHQVYLCTACIPMYSMYTYGQHDSSIGACTDLRSSSHLKKWYPLLPSYLKITQTIIECLRYITTGDMPPGTKGNAFIQDPKICGKDKVNAQVRLQFQDIVGKRCTVQRSMEATKKNKKIEMRTVDGTITRLGPDHQQQSLTSRCAEIDQEMINLLGVSKPILEDVIFCHQEDSNWPLAEGKLLKEKFDAIFASTRYVKALECIKKKKAQHDIKIREFQAELKYLKQNKESSEKMKRDLDESKGKLLASKAMVDKIKDEICPIEEKLEKILSKSADINRLNAKIGKMTGEREILLKTINELKESISNTFTGSDEELKDSLKQFHTKVQDQEKMLKKLDEEKLKLEKKLDALNKGRSSVDKDIGKQEQESHTNKENIRKRDLLMNDIANNFNFQGSTSYPVSNYDVERFKDQTDKVSTQFNDEIKYLKRKYEEKEADTMKESYRLRESKTRLEQDIHHKQTRLQKNQSELNDIDRKINQASTSNERLLLLDKEIEHVERDLKAEQESINDNETRNEIDSLQSEKKTLNSKLSALDSEMNQLHLQAAVRTELNLLTKQKTEKEESTKRIKARHEKTLTHLLQSIPSDNIRGSLDDFLLKLSDDIKVKEKSLQTKQMDLSKNDANRRMLKELLKKKEAEMRNIEEKIYDTCGSQNYDEGLQLLKQKLNCAQDQRGSLLGAEHFFRKYVNELKADDPCCPLCHREFDAVEEVRELVHELENKLKLVPRRLEQTEKDMAEYKTRYDALLQIKPLQDSLNKLEKEDIPDLKKQISDMSERVENLQRSIEEDGDELRLQKSDESLAASITPDVIMMDRTLSELRDLDRKVKVQRDKLQGALSDKTIEKANEEKMELHMTLETVAHQLEHKREKLRRHIDVVQAMKNQLNELTSEHLQVEREQQQVSKMAETKKVLSSENVTLETAIQEMKEQLAPVQSEIQKIGHQKMQITSEKEQMIEKTKTRIDSLAKNMSDFNFYQLSIISYQKAGKEDELTALRQQQNDILTSLGSVSEIKSDVAKRSDQLREELSNQQVRERELEDNLKIRSKMADVSILDEKINQLRNDIGGLDPIGLEKKKVELEKRKDDLQKESLTAQGRQRGYEDEIKRLEVDLGLEQYCDAEEKYREKMISIKTTEIANKDLGKYYKILDRAILDYHTAKMSVINGIISEIWSNTYKGCDIDRIEVRSDEDSDSGVMTRRIYHYRVVMIKDKVEMDMRGRCSAGQKVLASLIIRLALAETFCLNCGIFTLDEPTTNLDRENIESLANALVQIIRSRSHQRNFRLIVITHDEDFVELLGAAGFVDEFFKIRKNNRGYSCIARSSMDDIHTK